MKHRESFTDKSAVEAAQAAKWDHLVNEVLDRNAFYKRKYDAAGISSSNRPPLDALEQLPYTTKAELVQDQALHPPFGSNLAYEIDRYSRMHQTSGTSGDPLRWLDTVESWLWWLQCWREIYAAAGVTDQDRVFVPFSFGPFIGFWTAYEAGQACGAMMLPGGGMTSSQRIAALLANEASVLICTPTYALRLAEVAEQDGIDLSVSAVRVTIHAGEPGASIPHVRTRLESTWGAHCVDHTGATEVGAWGYSCGESTNVHIIEQEFVAEVVDRGIERPASPGGDGVETGELVLTNLGRLGSPVIRYRTGDLVELVRGGCPCGRETAYLRGGVLGRADDMIVVRGVNVYPSALENIVRSFDEIREFAVVRQTEGALAELLIRIETEAAGGERVARLLEERVHHRLQLRARVEVAATGTLPREEVKSKRFSVRS